jgi:hypothetical protein
MTDSYFLREKNLLLLMSNHEEFSQTKMIFVGRKKKTQFDGQVDNTTLNQLMIEVKESRYALLWE